ncbi:unnamed protein product, partial [Rotaria magnacalcarata]
LVGIPQLDLVVILYFNSSNQFELIMEHESLQNGVAFGRSVV